MKNIFEKETTDELISRIDSLNTNSQGLWGKMDVAQMMAHCSVSYEMVYDNIHPKPNGLVRFILKTFVKPSVVGEKGYSKSIKTAPVFIIKGDKDFELEKARLIAYLKRSQADGAAYFDRRESLSFGKLNTQEWNNMFYKHLDHHLNQFGV